MPFEQGMFPPESGCPRTVSCMRFEATIDVAAPAQLLFEVYTDVKRWPEWTDSVTSAERLDQGPLTVGSRARIKQPRLPATVWEGTEVVAGHSFTWMARGPGIITTASHVVTAPAGGGPVRVTASLEQAGLLGPLFGFLTKQLTNRYLQDRAPGSESSLRGVKRSETGVAVTGALGAHCHPQFRRARWFPEWDRAAPTVQVA